MLVGSAAAQVCTGFTAVGWGMLVLSTVKPGVVIGVMAGEAAPVAGPAVGNAVVESGVGLPARRQWAGPQSCHRPVACGKASLTSQTC